MRLYIAICVVMSATFAAAEEGRLQDCLRSVEQGDIVAASLAIASMRLSEADSEARECQSALDRIEDAADQRANDAERDEQLRQRTNNLLIDRDALAACNELYNEQITVAMTNQVCVTMFRKYGHPELDR